MDNKELIDTLRDESRYQAENFSRFVLSDELSAAANAIETLLAERDAAVEELRGICWCCAYGKKWDKAPPWSKMTTCEHIRESGALARSGGKTKCPHWQWRGPQKEARESEQLGFVPNLDTGRRARK